MFSNIKFLVLKSAILLFASTLVLSGCDVTSNDDDHDEHFEPWGMALFQGGNEIARQFQGEVTYSNGDHLEIGVGEESPLTTVRFLTEDGDTFVPEDDDYFLEWEIEHDERLEIEQHEEDGRWSFHFVGLEAGDAHVKFFLMHGQEGSAHTDFESLEFEVHVESNVHGLRVDSSDQEGIVSVDSDRNISGQFEVNEGSNSGELTIHFLDESGQPLDLDHDYELEFHVEDPAVATIEKVTGEEWVFIISGHQTGQTDVHFELYKHQDDDHTHAATLDDDHEGDIKIYESPHIDIIVN